MSSRPHTKAFAGCDLSDLPDVHGLDSDRLRVLWVLAAAEKEAAINPLTASQVSDVLRENCGIVLSRQRASSILAAEKQAITRVSRKPPPTYRIMKKGQDELMGSGMQPLFIDPDRALSVIRKVEEIFSSLVGTVRVCDPYIDNRSLDYIALASQAQEVRLLSENIQDSSKVRRDLHALTKQVPFPVEIRQAEKGQLHDRYVLHDGGMLLVGCSLKDLGKKQSMIVSLSTDFASTMTTALDKLWKKASKF